MPSHPDMTNYVTRTELREELETFEQRLDRKLDEKLAPYATKAHLDAVCTVLIERIERGEQRMERMEARLIDAMGRMRLEVHDDLQRHVQATGDDARRNVAALDHKYASLPERVERLEATVFRPKRQRRR